jgi:head-tail adaptor
MVSASELSAMRDAIEGLLPDTCYILSGTATADGQGGVTTSWGTTGTAICRLDMVEGREQLAGGAIQSYLKYMLSLPFDTSLLPTNRIAIGSSTYEVKSINLGQSWSAVARVELEKV